MQQRSFLLYTVIHNYGNPYEKWNIFVSRPHLWLQLGMVKPEIMLCETVLNLSTLNTVTCCSSFVTYASYLQSFFNGVRRCVCSWNNQHPFHRACRKSQRSILSGRSTDAKTSARHSSTVKLYVFQQDSAPAHRALETIKLLTVETREFIPPTLWPPNTSDLNPVDYKVWSVMQEKV